MNNFSSAKEHALSIAKTSLDSVINGKMNAQQILRSCYAVASMLGDSKNKEWINSELNGYRGKAPIPLYRKFRTLDDHDKLINYPLTESIHRIQHSVDSKKSLQLSDDELKSYKNMPPDWCYWTISGVQDRCLRFMIDVITQIEYSGTIQSIIENIQKEVSSKIVSINPKINSELQSISNELMSNDSTERSKAVHSCRRALKLLADDVYPAIRDTIDDASKTRNLSDNAYMNRLLAFLEENGRSLIIRNQVKHLASIFDSLREMAGKGEHSEITDLDAEHVVIYTYLIISEVLRCKIEV